MQILPCASHISIDIELAPLRRVRAQFRKRFVLIRWTVVCDVIGEVRRTMMAGQSRVAVASRSAGWHKRVACSCRSEQQRGLWLWPRPVVSDIINGWACTYTWNMIARIYDRVCACVCVMRIMHQQWKCAFVTWIYNTHTHTIHSLIWAYYLGRLVGGYLCVMSYIVLLQCCFAARLFAVSVSMAVCGNV